MPPPLPLTQTDAAHLDWSRSGTPAAPDFGDIYFSTDGGLDETRTVFLKGCGLPDRWRDKPVFTIAELGFGSGLNFLAAWQMWVKTAQAGQRLHFVSIEKFPFSAQQLAKALSAWPELTDLSQQLIAAWPGRVKGFHRLDFGSVTLTLIHDDVAIGLDSVAGLKANVWFLDGFSPSKNADMWSAGVLKQVGRLCAPEARLATFSVAGHVRNALTEAGFEVSKAPGFGRKRHRLEAVYLGAVDTSIVNIEKALIIGAGIAGRSLAKSLALRGIEFDVIDDQRHPAASGNPAALVKPRLDLQDRPESRFFLAAYLHALRHYEEHTIVSRGVRQIPKTPEQAKRFKKLAAQNPLGDGHLWWMDEALDIESALVINPKRIFDDYEIRREAASLALSRKDYSHVLIAAGYGIQELSPDLNMRFSRGQLSWAKEVVDTPIAYGGYAIPLSGETLIGATHDRLGDDDPFKVTEEDDAKNLQDYADMTGTRLSTSNTLSRASVRVTSKDTLPRITDLGDRRWALTGLGSRGFTFAPLLAEALVSDICGEVSPLERAVIARFEKH